MLCACCMIMTVLSQLYFLHTITPDIIMTSTDAGTGTCKTWNNDGGIILCNLFQKPCALSKFCYAGTEVESYARSGHPFFPSGQAETTGRE
jgi:hypothetical protein